MLQPHTISHARNANDESRTSARACATASTAPREECRSFANSAREKHLLVTKLKYKPGSRKKETSHSSYLVPTLEAIQVIGQRGWFGRIWPK